MVGPIIACCLLLHPDVAERDLTWLMSGCVSMGAPCLTGHVYIFRRKLERLHMTEPHRGRLFDMHDAFPNGQLQINQSGSQDSLETCQM